MIRVSGDQVGEVLRSARVSRNAFDLSPVERTPVCLAASNATQCSAMNLLSSVKSGWRPRVRAATC